LKSRLVFLGPPGAGKGTCASRVSAKVGIPSISTGDLLRAAVKEGTELGMKAKGYMDAGNLVPDGLVIDMLKERIAQPDCEKGFILDGFPRTLEQARALEGITPIDLVINMVVPEEIVVARLGTRITCRQCGEIYNTRTLPPKQEGICDKCGGELYQRDDQKPEVIKKRLEVYRKETEPLIQYYREKGILLDILTESIDEPPEIKVNQTLEAMGVKE